jgi:DNA-binding phage protein
MSAKPTSGAFAGVTARNRQQAYDVLVDAIKRSALSQARIAEQAGISQEHLSRMLQRPRNVELDTLSKIVFAASGAALKIDLSFPILAAAKSLKPAGARSR